MSQILLLKCCPIYITESAARHVNFGEFFCLMIKSKYIYFIIFIFNIAVAMQRTSLLYAPHVFFFIYSTHRILKYVQLLNTKFKILLVLMTSSFKCQLSFFQQDRSNSKVWRECVLSIFYKVQTKLATQKKITFCQNFGKLRTKYR